MALNHGHDKNSSGTAENIADNFDGLLVNQVLAGNILLTWRLLFPQCPGPSPSAWKFVPIFCPPVNHRNYRWTT